MLGDYFAVNFILWIIFRNGNGTTVGFVFKFGGVDFATFKLDLAKKKVCL